MKSKVSIHELSRLGLTHDKTQFLEELRISSYVKVMFDNLFNSGRRSVISGVCKRIRRNGISTTLLLQSNDGYQVSVPVYSPLVKKLSLVDR
uniref:Ribosomal protein L19 n=1 Tax=Ophirina amphinema TaxID=2108040 RepID=A0A348AYS5_9EUKA|nr:ribosomal protein L19 [Ophirina amphinema]